MPVSLVTPSTSVATSSPNCSRTSSSDARRVLDRVVQQRRAQRLGVEAHAGADLRDADRVDDEVLAGLAPLVGVVLAGEDERRLDARRGRSRPRASSACSSTIAKRSESSRARAASGRRGRPARAPPDARRGRRASCRPRRRRPRPPFARRASPSPVGRRSRPLLALLSRWLSHRRPLLEPPLVGAERGERRARCAAGRRRPAGPARRDRARRGRAPRAPAARARRRRGPRLRPSPASSARAPPRAVPPRAGRGRRGERVAQVEVATRGHARAKASSCSPQARWAIGRGSRRAAPRARLGRRVERDHVGYGARERRVARRARRRSTARSRRARPASACGARGASAQTTSTGSPVATSAASVPAMPPPRRSRRGRGDRSAPAAPASRRRAARVEPRRAAAPTASSARRASSIGAGRAGQRVAQHRRGSTAPFHSLSSRPNGGVERPSSAPSGSARGAEGDARARRAAGLDGEAHVLALPHRPRVGQPRGGHEQRDLRVALAERRERARAPRRASSAELVAGDDGVDALPRHEVLRARARRRVGDEGGAERVDAARRAIVSPAAARWPPWRAGARRAASARRAGRTPGSSGPSRCPRRRRARSARTGRWWRSAMREATIPITPGMPALAGQHVARALARPRRPGPRPRKDARLDVAALGVGARRAPRRSPRRARRRR